jgi:hypothetical protein
VLRRVRFRQARPVPARGWARLDSPADQVPEWAEALAQPARDKALNRGIAYVNAHYSDDKIAISEGGVSHFSPVLREVRATTE